MIGDVVGSPGRRALSAILPGLRRELSIDVIVANGENAAAGRGLTTKTAREMFQAGVDIISSGNHIWDQREIIEELDSEAPILRPANYPPGSPGRGIVRFNGLTVINLQGRTFMANIDDPFRCVDALLAREPQGPIVVDMHAEATSEKVAMGWYLDGRVAAVVGTHTHVPTADPRLLPNGTAYVSDARHDRRPRQRPGLRDLGVAPALPLQPAHATAGRREEQDGQAQQRPHRYRRRDRSRQGHRARRPGSDLES